MKDKILEHFESELSRSSPHTRQNRMFYAQKFLRFAGDRPLSEWNKSLVNDFLKRLEEEGYAPGSIRFGYSVVKRVFDAAGAVHEAEKNRLISETDPNNPGAVAEILKALSLPGPSWDMGKRSAPKVESSDTLRPSHTLEDMAVMIEAAKSGVLVPEETVYLALASIYGWRREELCLVRAEHIDFDKKTIYVLTVKGGEKRAQLLCDAIVPYLSRYDFNSSYSLFGMSQLYWRICAKAAVEPEEGSGWHAIRRCVETEVRDALATVAAANPDIRFDPLLYSKIFFRYKRSSSPEMVDRYYTKEALEVDEFVLRHHPIVELWA